MIISNYMKEEQMLYAMCDSSLPQEIKEATLVSIKAIEL